MCEWGILWGMPGGKLWLSQFMGTSTVPSMCYHQLCRMPLFFFSFWEKLVVHLEPLIFHFSGWQWKKSVSVTDRTLEIFLGYLM